MKRFLSKTLNPQKRRQTPSVRPSIEMLEGRTLLDVGINGSVVEIVGKVSTADNVVIRFNGVLNKIVVIWGHDGTEERSRFDPAAVSRIDFYGRGGDDFFLNETAEFCHARGGTGKDTLIGGSGWDKLYGGTQQDMLIGGEGTDYLYGGTNDDILLGWGINLGGPEPANPGDDWLYGEDGNDFLGGYSGTDVLYGGIGNDTLYGGGGFDNLYGQGDNDLMYGHGDVDLMYGGDGSDTMYGGAGGDYLYGEGDADYLYGEGDNDFLDGGGWYNFLFGGQGNDLLIGGDAADEMHGQAGADTLWGGQGIDTMYGGAGNDHFYDRNYYGGPQEWDGDTDYIYGGLDNDSAWFHPYLDVLDSIEFKHELF